MHSTQELLQCATYLTFLGSTDALSASTRPPTALAAAAVADVAASAAATDVVAAAAAATMAVVVSSSPYDIVVGVLIILPGYDRG
jgi:hypothetical protein